MIELDIINEMDKKKAIKGNQKMEVDDLSKNFEGGSELEDMDLENQVEELDQEPHPE